MKRIGIVGCGAIAGNHALGIQDLGYECAAVTDIRREAAEAFVKKYPELRADFLQSQEWMTAGGRKELRKLFPTPKVYPNVRAMEEDGSLDAVIIATLPPSHCDLSCQASEAGAQAVLCEKPMAMSLAECRKMMEICKRNGTRLASYADTTALWPQIVEARKIIEAGEIGKIEFIHMQCSATLMDISVYQWAGLQHLFPDRGIETIQAALDLSGEKVSFGHAQEDSAVVYFVMTGGIQGLLLSGTENQCGHWIRINGSKGDIQIELFRHPRLRVRRIGAGSWEDILPPNKCGYADRRDLLKGIVEGNPDDNNLDGESGLRSVLPVFAAWQSHLERRTIYLSKPVTAAVPLEHEARPDKKGCR